MWQTSNHPLPRMYDRYTKKKHIHTVWHMYMDLNTIHSPNMFTLTHIPQLSTVAHRWLPLRGSTVTLPHPHVTPLPHGYLPAVALTCLALCNLSEVPEISQLSTDKAYYFRVLPLSCTGQSIWRRAPWGCQTAWGHLDCERCIWMKNLDFPCLVSVQYDKATSSPAMCFSTSLMKSAALASSGFD